MDQIRTILVVEDDNALRDMVSNQLRTSYNVLAAPDGETAWQSLQSSQIDLIVLDLLLPKVSGFELLDQVRSLPYPQIANLPVIILSNFRDEDSVRRASELGVIEYFTKSDVTLNVLSKRIDRYFQEHDKINTALEPKP